MDLASYIQQKRSRGVFTEKTFDRFLPEPTPETPVVIDGTASIANRVSNSSDFDRIAKPVLTSWLKGKGGLASVSRSNAWDTNKVGGATANQYFQNAKKFDNPNLPLAERVTQMIYGAETSGDPNAWKTTNPYGYMGRAQMGRPFMQDYGIDPNRYMADPKYQHQETIKAVQKRIEELRGTYY